MQRGPAQPLPELDPLRRGPAEPRSLGAPRLAPPHADAIKVVNGAPVLDAFGNVTGGLRSPFLDVPTGTWFGSSTGASFCFIAGHEVPFSHEQLRQLYPSHGRYVDAVSGDVGKLVEQRIITAPDGVRLVSEAAHADVP